ncbi:hypothetical protein B0H10DRAFT_1954192 [Mycena sp. CBHHK59/15]|nr:hypothetical protein B0H10DRAFT_1954192 [Mycena sp. CBHHK59/15]
MPNDRCCHSVVPEPQIGLEFVRKTLEEELGTHTTVGPKNLLNFTSPLGFGHFRPRLRQHLRHSIEGYPAAAVNFLGNQGSQVFWAHAVMFQMLMRATSKKPAAATSHLHGIPVPVEAPYSGASHSGPLLMGRRIFFKKKWPPAGTYTPHSQCNVSTIGFFRGAAKLHHGLGSSPRLFFSKKSRRQAHAHSARNATYAIIRLCPWEARRSRAEAP